MGLGAIPKRRKIFTTGVTFTPEPVEPLPEDKPPTAEEIAYSNLVAMYPMVEYLVERLNLVSCSTGEKIRKVSPINTIT
jgi:hypothetical protein